MTLFDEPFTDPAKLTRDWIVAAGMVVQHGVLTFAPGEDDGYCAGLTRRHNFGDFSLTAEVRVVRGAVGLVLRATGPDQYYMVQFDLVNDPRTVWFHTFTPSAKRGFRVERIPSAHAPQAERWHRMSVVVRGPSFEVSLDEPGGPLRHCASWQDREKAYQQGALGVWEHGGEAGEYRALRVDALAAGA